MKLINADEVIKTLRARKNLFCRNRIEFCTLSTDQKARVDEIDTCIGELVNAEEVLTIEADTISRQAVIEVIDSFNVFESRCDQIKLEQMIGELPPAQHEIIRCNYVKACNEATMDKPTSAYTYLSVLEDLKEHGYVLVDMRGVME